MLSSCRTVLLLLLLLLKTGIQAQSGDGDTDAEPRIRCTSDITLQRNQLNCELLGGPNANEDDEDSDRIERMSVCYLDYSNTGGTCEHSSGGSINLTMTAVSDFSLIVQLKSGRNITETHNLQKIVKPRSPSVQNVTFNLESNQAVIWVQTPYKHDYLKVQNQLFQLHISTAGSEMTQNISASESMKMDMQNLHRDSEYQVRVRAIPINHLRGSWSEWSERFTFITPADATHDGDGRPVERRQNGYILIVCLVSLVLVTFSTGFLWKHKIFSYMWPSIPHPKHTLVQICKPNGGLLLNFSPEVFSALKVYPMEKAGEEPAEETEPTVGPAAAERTGSNEPCSTQSSECRSTTSASTEELELSALLSRTSSDGEESLQSHNPSPINTPQPDHSNEGNQVLVFGVGQQEEAYVTMSSFYQIK